MRTLVVTGAGISLASMPTFRNVHGSRRDGRHPVDGSPRRLRLRAVNPTENSVGAYGDDHVRAHAEVWLPGYVASL